MAERKMIQVDKDVAERLKEMYPDLSWTSILRLLLDQSTIQPSGKGVINQSTIQAPIKEMPIQDNQYASIKDLSALKEKFSTALSDIISQNNLKYIKK